jgi:hypothetical protein
MLNSASQTYQDNGLDAVDLNNGVPMVYVLMYGPQSQKIVLQGESGDSLAVEATNGVGRLHIFAEATMDMHHDAIPVLNACVSPPFDLNIRRFTVNAPPEVVPAPDATLSYNEQLSLSERGMRRDKQPTCCEMVPADGQVLGNPRTCTPIIAMSTAPLGRK